MLPPRPSPLKKLDVRWEFKPFSEKSVRELGNFLDLARTKTRVFYKRNLGDVSDILNLIFPRFKRSFAPQQLCTSLRSSNAQGGMETENSRPPLCDWLHLLIHASRKRSQLLLNCWSPPIPVFVLLLFLLQLCVHEHVEYYTLTKRRTLSYLKTKQQYLVCHTHTTRSLLGSDTDMVF